MLTEEDKLTSFIYWFQWSCMMFLYGYWSRCTIILYCLSTFSFFHRWQRFEFTVNPLRTWKCPSNTEKNLFKLVDCTYVFLRWAVVVLVWLYSYMWLLFKVLLQLSLIGNLIVDLVLTQVSAECECSLRLFAVLVHQNLLLVVQTHTHVSIIVFLVFSHLLQEMLVICFWGTRTVVSLERGEFFVQMSLYIYITYDFARVENWTSSLCTVQLEGGLCNFAKWRLISWLYCAKLLISKRNRSINFYCFWHASLEGRMWIKTTIIIILNGFKVSHSLSEFTSLCSTKTEGSVETCLSARRSLGCLR